MSLNRYLKSHTLQFHSVYQSDTAFLIIRDKDRTKIEAKPSQILYLFSVFQEKNTHSLTSSKTSCHKQKGIHASRIDTLSLILILIARKIIACNHYTRQTLSVSYDLLHDVQPTHDAHWQLPFFHENRAYSFFFCLKVGMFFSLLYSFYVIILSYDDSGCKNRDFF